MEVLAFDLVGKMAHFRKYYANNTALSFGLPPRTTLMGVLAAILGLPRDTYYAALSSQHLRLGVGARVPLKKAFHRLNYLKVEGSRDLDGSKGRIQLPFEVVTGYDLARDMVRYRVYVSPTASGTTVFEQLWERLRPGGAGPHFALALGTANFGATVEAVRRYTDVRLVRHEGVAAFHSAVPTDRVAALPTSAGELSVEEELLPADFVGDGQRELATMNRVLFSTNGQPLLVQVMGDFVELGEGPDLQRILFLEA
jgi:CRISPR-associated protein Cas5h